MRRPNSSSLRRRPIGSLIVTAVAIGLLPALGLALAACGGSDDTATTTTGGSATVTTQKAEMSGEELGNAAGAAWAEAMQKLVTTLESKPDVATAKPQVADLKEEYVQKLVALGRQIAELDAGDKAKANARIVAALESAAGADWYKSYMDLYKEYSAGDLDFANLLASFNILTQYADFELLKTQAPDEAARLGIQ